MPVYAFSIRIGRAKTRSVVVQETSSTDQDTSYPTWFTNPCHIPPENNHNLEAAKHRLVSTSRQSEFPQRDFDRGCRTDLDYLIIVEQFKLASSDRVRNQLGLAEEKLTIPSSHSGLGFFLKPLFIRARKYVTCDAVHQAYKLQR